MWQAVAVVLLQGARMLVQAQVLAIMADSGPLMATQSSAVMTRGTSTSTSSSTRLKGWLQAHIKQRAGGRRQAAGHSRVS